MLSLPVVAESADIAFLGHDGTYWQAWVMDEQGQQVRKVTTSPYDKARISWLPDGQRLLVNGVQGQLEVVGLDGRVVREVSLPVARTTDAAMSPDGKYIAFSLRTAEGIDTNDIWVSRADGTSARPVIKLPYLQHLPAWGPHARWIYFSSGRGGQEDNLWKVHVETRQLEQLTSGALYNFEADVWWSGAIAFSSNRETGDYDIWIRDIDGTERRVAPLPGRDGWPSWSPDGRSIVFHRFENGVPNLWHLDVEKGSARRITSFEHGAMRPAWFRGGAR